jgi:hypothetical protein
MCARGDNETEAPETRTHGPSEPQPFGARAPRCMLTLSRTRAAPPHTAPVARTAAAGDRNAARVATHFTLRLRTPTHCVSPRTQRVSPRVSARAREHMAARGERTANFSQCRCVARLKLSALCGQGPRLALTKGVRDA